MKGGNLSTPPRPPGFPGLWVNPEIPRPPAFSSAGGSDQHALGIRGSAFSPSFSNKGEVQFQGRGAIGFAPHPEGHLVAVFSGYFFSGCSSAWPECALWTRDVSGSNPLTQTNSWKVHHLVGEHTVNVSYVGSSPTFPAKFCVASSIVRTPDF